jgi:hypothetical protein
MPAVDPQVAWDASLSVGPHQRDKVDSLDDPMVLARPVSSYKIHLCCIRLVKSGVVDYDHVHAFHHCLCFLPHRPGVLGMSLQKARKGSWDGTLFRLG